MNDFDPIDREPGRPSTDRAPMVERENGLVTIGILIAALVAIGAGVYLWTETGTGQLLAYNTSPTTMSPSSPDSSKTDSR